MWLLLDGLDEMSASSGNPLTEIARQFRQLGLISQARIVLSCRVNLWDGNIINALDEYFDIYRTLDYSYPKDVEEFIHKLFNKIEISETGKRLCTTLKESANKRIQDLVKNPLRLTLLCFNWQSGEGKLPDTQAGLYQQFVDDFYKWKKEEFATNYHQRQQLNIKLGELAKAAIDKEATRFRLQQDFVSSFLGDADDENSLLKLALNRGWLNCVGIDTSRKPVYAFFHTSFQEYFAAKAIDDWHFFLNHVPKNPSQGTYRIFELQWKQPFLLWLGREELAKDKKQALITALIKFRDRCGVRFFQNKVNKGFYEYRAYFLAAAGIAEFKDYSRTDEIVAQIVTWTIDGLRSIKEQARSALQQTDHTKVINALVKLLHSTDVFEINRCQVAEILGQIDPGNSNAIATLVQLLQSTDEYYEIIRWQAAISLGKIGTGNEKAIAAFEQLLQLTDLHKDTYMQVAKSLGQIDPGNQNAIAALVQVLQSSDLHEDTRWQAAYSLQEIGTGNKNVIVALVELLQLTDLDKDTRKIAASSLREIAIGNQNVTAALVQLLQSPDLDKDTRWLAAYSLQEIGTDNKDVIVALAQLLQSTDLDKDTRMMVTYSLWEISISSENEIATLIKLLESKNFDHEIRRQAAFRLGHIDPGNPQAIAALVQMLQSTQVDVNIRMYAAENLGQIDPGNDLAIATWVQLLESTQIDDYIRKRAAKNLGEIGRGNKKAIAALGKLLELTDIDDDARMYVAEKLGQIDPGNQNAIAALVELLQSKTVDKDTRRLVAKNLGKIGTDNEKAIAALVQLLESTNVDDLIRRLAEESLGQILNNNHQFAVVKTLSGYQQLDDDCYSVIWECAQNMPYPDFYQAWHQHNFVTRTMRSLKKILFTRII